MAAIAAVGVANQAEAATSKPPGETFHLPAIDFSDSRDSGQFDDLHFSSAGGITKEEYLLSTEEEGSEFRYSSSETDIPLPLSDDGGDTRGPMDQEDDGEIQRDAIQEAIAEISADFVSGNLVCFYCHSTQ